MSDKPVSAAAIDRDWWKGAVIYQIYPRSFQDSNGDGIGDLPGITSRLGYVADLGVDAIWLSPFFTSPMKDFGYDVSNYTDVDPIFGSIKDFEALTARAHQLGLKVIIDQVISHTSDMHPRADWYVWADAAPDGTAPNNWLSIFGGPAWEWDSRRCQYYMHNFLASQPDLNFHNKNVQEALLGTMRFWLERGVDGFRLDTINYYFHDKQLRNNPPLTRAATSHDAPLVNPYGRQEHLYDKTQPENLTFLKRVRALLDEFPGSTSVGEVGDGDRSLQTMAEYTAGGDKLHMCYTFDLLGDGFSPGFFRTTMENFAAAKGGWPCWAFSNHDVRRHASRFLPLTKNPERQAKLVASLLLSLRGSACLYEGEELGLTEGDLAFEDLVDPYGIRFWPEFKGRDGCRTPMVWDHADKGAGFTSGKPWLPIPDAHRLLAVDLQAGKAGSVLEHYRQFLAFRKGLPALQKGELTFLDAPDGLLVFTRQFGNESLLCAFNFTEDDMPLTLLPQPALSPLPGSGFEHKKQADIPVILAEGAFFARLL
jgi:alpha-glucosidase